MIFVCFRSKSGTTLHNMRSAFLRSKLSANPLHYPDTYVAIVFAIHPGSLPGRPEMKSRDAHCEIESPLSAYRNRLQCNGAIGAADEHVSS